MVLYPRESRGRGRRNIRRQVNDYTWSLRPDSGRGAIGCESAKDAIKSGADAVASVDLSTLGDDVAKLTQTVSGLVQKQTSSARDQVVVAVGAAADNISQATSAAQDNLVYVEAGIKNNPWTAVAIAALVGLLIGKMS
jgi:ElaB/YqjD/DUF883 family membrane-anchored ribosome-binding protein